MQLVAEDRGCSAHFLLVFILDRCSGEAEEHSPRKCFLDRQQHLSESRTMTFINNEHNPFGAHHCQVRGLQSFAFLADIAHFLDRSHNQRVCWIAAFELADQHMGILCLLNGVALLLLGQSGSGKVAILLQRLCTELNPVHQENHLVRVPRCSNQLSGLERGHRFSRASGVPNVATQLLTRFPAGATYLV